MTDDREVVLSAAFSAELDTPSKTTLKDLCTNAGLVAGAFGLGRHVPQHYWSTAGANTLKALKSALNQPIADIIAGAWQRYEPFLKYRDPQRFPPNVPAQEDLLEHTIELRCHPTVDVLLEGEKVDEIRFDVTVQLQLASATLTIQGGKFMSARPGPCSVSGTVKYKNVKLIERKSEELRLPGEIRFGNGVPILPGVQPRVPVPAN